MDFLSQLPASASAPASGSRSSKGPKGREATGVEAGAMPFPAMLEKERTTGPASQGGSSESASQESGNHASSTDALGNETEGASGQSPSTGANSPLAGAVDSNGIAALARGIVQSGQAPNTDVPASSLTPVNEGAGQTANGQSAVAATQIMGSDVKLAAITAQLGSLGARNHTAFKDVQPTGSSPSPSALPVPQVGPDNTPVTGEAKPAQLGQPQNQEFQARPETSGITAKPVVGSPATGQTTTPQAPVHASPSALLDGASASAGKQSAVPGSLTGQGPVESATQPAVPAESATDLAMEPGATEISEEAAANKGKPGPDKSIQDGLLKTAEQSVDSPLKVEAQAETVQETDTPQQDAKVLPNQVPQVETPMKHKDGADPAKLADQTGPNDAEIDGEDLFPGKKLQNPNGRITASNASRLSQPQQSASFEQKIRTQVARQLSSSLQGVMGGEKVTLQLNPEKLGQVEIQFLARGNDLSIMISAQNMESEKAIREGLRELSESIADKSTRWQQVDIKVDQRHGDQDRPEARQDNRKDQNRSGNQQQQQNRQGRQSGGNVDWTSLQEEG